jgi:hypothetical protein
MTSVFLSYPKRIVFHSQISINESMHSNGSDNQLIDLSRSEIYHAMQPSH